MAFLTVRDKKTASAVSAPDDKQKADDKAIMDTPEIIMREDVEVLKKLAE